MDHDPVFLAIDIKPIFGPIRANLRRRIDHYVPIGKTPNRAGQSALSSRSQYASLREDRLSVHRIGFVTGYVHED